MADRVSVNAYTNTSKPFDLSARPFHRINAPAYDLAKDPPVTAAARPAPRGLASGRGGDCGCRGPEDLLPSVVTSLLAGVVVDALNTFLNVILPFKAAVDAFITRINGLARRFLNTPDLDFPKLFLAEVKKFITNFAEGLLFGRLMRSVPQWVPVGRTAFDETKFVYDDKPVGQQASTREEEREVEGLVVRSYQMSNDIPHIQWARFARWALHVRPLPGFEYLFGKGNIQSEEETAVIDNSNFSLEPAVKIYGLGAATGREREIPVLECLLDTGAVSRPPGDSSTPDLTVPGIMFNGAWPFWPVGGDHVWAVGRWAYDCSRVAGTAKLNPTQLNPLKAVATARFEGFKFVSNPAGVPAVRFLFYATSEGGYVDFRPRTAAEQPRGPDGKPRTGAIRKGLTPLRDRDYEFIVDLPPAPEGRDRHPIGHTPDFLLNNLALRASLLTEVQQASEFTVQQLNADTAPPDGVTFVELEPIIEVIRPADRTRAPTQVKVTVPLTKLPGAADSRVACGFVLNMGWHDPGAALIKDLVKVTVSFDRVAFTTGGTVRFKTGINGRWSSVGTEASELNGHSAIRPNKGGGGEVFFLPRDAAITVSCMGTRRRGIGAFREGKSPARTLTVGGLLDIKKGVLQDILRKFGKIPLISELIPPSTRATLKAIDDLIDNVPDDLLGPRFKVDWDLDVDTDKDQSKKDNPDGTKKNARATAVARELATSPTPVLNRVDAALGLIETLDEPTRLVQHRVLATLPDGTAQESNLLDMAFMVKLLQTNNLRSLTGRFAFGALRTEQVGGGNVLAEWRVPGPTLIAGKFDPKEDYTLFGRVTVELT